MFFKDVHNLAQFRDEKLTKRNIYESDEFFLDIYGLMPGQEQTVHTHADEEKVYYVLEGEVTVTIGEDERTLRKCEGAVAPKTVPHGVSNRGEDAATLLVFMAPHPRSRTV